MISLIVAASTNNVIGTGGELPWHLPDDFRYFKELTMGKPIVMGRRTWDSIGKPLPGRQNIVLTRQSDWSAEGAEVVTSTSAALQAAGDVDEIMVIGGGQLYEVFLPMASRVYLTSVAVTLDGDTFFSELDCNEWQLSSSRPHSADERHEYQFEFNVYDRIIGS